MNNVTKENNTVKNNRSGRKFYIMKIKGKRKKFFLERSDNAGQKS